MAKRAVPEHYLAVAVMYPKWQRAVAAVKRAIADTEAGSGEWQPIKRAKDRLYKLVDEAAGHAPLGYKDPAVAALITEIEALPSIESAMSAGRAVREKQWQIERKRLLEEEREAKRPYEWMRR